MFRGNLGLLHYISNFTCSFVIVNYLLRRKWQTTPVFFPGKSHGQRSLTGYSPWGVTKSQTRLSNFTFTFFSWWLKMIGMVLLRFACSMSLGKMWGLWKHLNHTVKVLCMLFFVISRLQHQWGFIKILLKNWLFNQVLFLIHDCENCDL